MMSILKSSLAKCRVVFFAIGMQLTFAALALAETTGMPWEAGLEKVIKSVNGPIAKGAGIVSIVGAGAGMAFSEQGSGLKKVMTLALAMGTVFTASAIITDVFAFTGSTTF